MKLKKTASLLLAVILTLCLFTGCSAKSKLVGTWEEEKQASIFGIEINTGTVTVSFEKDGTGSLSGELGSTGLSASQDFTYTVEKDQLTMTFESGNTMVFTFTLEKDVLKLDGDTALELTKVS